MGAGLLAAEEVWQELELASQANGLIQDDGQFAFERTLRNGLAAGQAEPHDVSRLLARLKLKL